MRWLVSQIGAREHYSIPRGFEARGHLRTLYTDFWCRHFAGMIGAAPMPIRAIAGRRHPHLDARRVVSFSVRTLLDRLGRGRPTTTEAAYDSYLRFGQLFSNLVRNHLSRQSLDPAVDFFFGVNTGALESLQLLKERGIRSIIDQIDPARTEDELVHQEAEKFPGWEKLPGRIPDRYFDRLSREWALADVVLVNSEWSKSALIAQGVPAEKLLVVPVSYEVDEPAPQRAISTGPLKVLWLGTVNLRKGIQYLFEAARLIKDRRVEFQVVGRVEISELAVKSAPSNVHFGGRVDRAGAVRLYRQADVFVLPTISDGFAITQVEAMACGLPVITTPRCGDVVTHGQDGLIVPACDGAALAEAIATLDDDRAKLREFSNNALVKCRQFSLHHHTDLIEDRARRIPSR